MVSVSPEIIDQFNAEYDRLEEIFDLALQRKDFTWRDKRKIRGLKKRVGKIYARALKHTSSKSEAFKAAMIDFIEEITRSLKHFTLDVKELRSYGVSYQTLQHQFKHFSGNSL